MKSMILLSLLAAAALPVAAVEAETFKFETSFETPVKRGYAPGIKSKIFIAPPKDMVCDVSGTRARTGKGAIALKVGQNLVMDNSLLKPGKVYTISVWARADKAGIPATAGFLWFKGRGAFKGDNQTVRTTGTEWVKISKTVKAPEGFNHVYFVLNGGTKTDSIWFDDFAVTEETAEGK